MYPTGDWTCGQLIPDFFACFKLLQNNAECYQSAADKFKQRFGHDPSKHSNPRKAVSCVLFGAGLASGVGELVEFYRGVQAGKDVVDLVAEFAQRYLGKARKNQAHIGGFGAGMVGSALTGGCVP